MNNLNNTSRKKFVRKSLNNLINTGTKSLNSESYDPDLLRRITKTSVLEVASYVDLCGFDLDNNSDESYDTLSELSITEDEYNDIRRQKLS